MNKYKIGNVLKRTYHTAELKKMYGNRCEIWKVVGGYSDNENECRVRGMVLQTGCKIFPKGWCGLFHISNDGETRDELLSEEEQLAWMI